MKTKIKRLNPALELLKDELEFREISKAQAARDMNIPRSRLTNIVAGRKRISVDTALRLERYLGIEAAWWLELQQKHELRIAGEEKKKELNLVRVYQA
jgi:addiction module HigA family antidote